MAHDSWGTFTRALAGDLFRLNEADTVIFHVTETRLVQALQRDSVLHLEAWPADEPAFGAAGWHSNRDPARPYATWWHDVPMPHDRARYGAAAELVATTLRDVLKAGTPAALTVKSFNIAGPGEVPVEAVRIAGIADPDRRDRAFATLFYGADRRFDEVRLAAAAAEKVVAERYPTARLVATTGGAAGRNNVPAFQDRVVYVPPPAERLVVIAERAAGTDPGMRHAPDPARPDAMPWKRYPQGTYPYLRVLLDLDMLVTAGLAKDPQAADAVRRFLAGKAIPVTYLLVAFHPDGTPHTWELRPRR